MNILFLDTETTGTDANCNSIIQLAAEFHINGSRVSSFNQKLKPYKERGIVNLGALRVNNTRLAVLVNNDSEYSTSNQVAVKFVDFLLDCKNKVGKEPIILCGHNVHFDAQFIKTFLNDHNVEGLESIIGYHYLDTASIGTSLVAAGLVNLEKFNLQKLVNYFDIKVEENDDITTLNTSYHDASYDTAMTAKLYYAMIDLLRGTNEQQKVAN